MEINPQLLVLVCFDNFPVCIHYTWSMYCLADYTLLGIRRIVQIFDVSQTIQSGRPRMPLPFWRPDTFQGCTKCIERHLQHSDILRLGSRRIGRHHRRLPRGTSPSDICNRIRRIPLLGTAGTW